MTENQEPRNDAVTPRTLVIIPTYNEALNITNQVTGVRENAPEVDILVVDDGSPDGTGAIVDSLAAADDHIHVMHRTEKGGLGAAYIAGFRWGLERGYDFLCEMDADGSHRAEDFPYLLARATTDPSLALVIGSRWVPGGSVVNWPWYRKVLSRGGNTYTRIMMGMPVKDATAGFRVYRAETLSGIDLDTVESRGYCFQVDMTQRVVRSGGVIAEVPITFVERVVGLSKMSQQIVNEALKKTTMWGLKYRLGQLTHRRG